MKQEFLNQFDPTTQKKLIRYCDHLSSLDVDVFVLMARKAACFFHCLEHIGMVRTNAIVTTDRILGMDMSWLEGKRVALIDELVISGTTLRDAKSLINEKVNGISVTCHVLAVNEDHWKSQLIQPDNAYTKLKDSKCTELGADIVRAMSILPRPYSIDYPLFSECSLLGEDIKALALTPGWNSHDVTSQPQLKYGVRVLTVTPTKTKLDSIGAKLGIKLESRNIPKIRIYGRTEYISGRINKFTFRVLPIFIFSPIYEEKLNSFFLRICELADINQTQISNFTTGKSKLRLLQYIAAYRIADTWLRDINRLIPDQTSLILEIDERELSFLFPPNVIKSVRSLIENIAYLNIEDEFEDIEFSSGAMPEQITSQAPMTTPINYIDAQQILGRPFYEMFIQKEKALREFVNKYGVDALYSEKNKNIRDRLKRGITIDELVNYIRKTSKENELTDDEGANVVSLFLDIAIDSGITVPITAKFDTVKGPVISRALRHGEEVKVSAREFYLISRYLKSYSKNSRIETLPKTFLEKLLVLFIQAGATSGILERYNERLNEYYVSSVKTYAFGAMTQLGKKGLTYQFDPSASLSKHLVELGVIEECKDSPGYKILPTPENLKASLPSRIGEETKAELQSQVFGEIIASEFRNTISKPDIGRITNLATCLYPINALLGLAGDINVFLDRWESGLQARVLAPDLHLKYKSQSAQELTKDFSYRALISGIEKYKAIQGTSPLKLYEKLKLKYCGMDLARQSLWKELWEDPLICDDNASMMTLKNITNELGQWLNHMACLLDIYCISVLLRDNKFREGEELSKEANRKIKNLLRKYKRSKRILSLWAAFKSELGHNQELETDLIDEINLMIGEGKKLLKSVEILAGKHDEIPQIETYGTVLKFVAIVPDERKGNIRIFLDDIQEIIGKAIRTARNPSLKAPDTHEKGRAADHSSSTNDRWIVVQDEPTYDESKNRISFSLIGNGKRSSEWQVYLAEKVLRRLGNQLRIRFTLYADLKWDLVPYSRNIWEDRFVDNLWKIESDIEQQLPYSVSSEIVMVSSDSTSGSSMTSAKSKLSSLWRKKLVMDSSEVLKAGSYEEHTLRVERVKVGTIMVEKTKKELDVGILTILPEEFGAVKAQLENGRDVPESELSSTDLCYEGVFNIEGGSSRSVVLYQSPDQGNVQMSITANHLMRDYAPKILILLGIAGSINNKLQIGDVVIANEVIYYELSKDSGPKNRENRITSFRQSRWVKNQVNRMLAKNGSSSTMKLKDDSGSEFTTIAAPIGSGEKVVASKDSEIRAVLKFTQSKNSAVEMEAAGISMLHESESDTDEYSVKHLIIIRGISDQANTRKNDSDHARASNNAVIVLRRLIESMDWSRID